MFSIHLCIWIGVMTIVGTSAAFSFRSSSLLTFVGGGRWINLHQPKKSHTQLPVQFDTVKNSFTQSLRSMSVVEDHDGAAHLDLLDAAGNFLWTPELVILDLTQLLSFVATKLLHNFITCMYTIYAGCQVIV